MEAEWQRHPHMRRMSTTMNIAHTSAPTLAVPQSYSHMTYGGIDAQMLGLGLHRPTNPPPSDSNQLPNMRPSTQVGGWPTGGVMGESGGPAESEWSIPQSGRLGNWNETHPVITPGPSSVSICTPFSPSSNPSRQPSLGPCTIYGDHVPAGLATLRPIKVPQNHWGGSTARSPRFKRSQHNWGVSKARKGRPLARHLNVEQSDNGSTPRRKKQRDGSCSIGFMEPVYGD